MNSFKRRAFNVKIVIFIFIVLSTQVSAKKNVTLGIPVFPPYSVIDELANQCVGDFISVTKKILADSGFTVDVVCAPPTRIYRALKSAEIDFIINVKSTKSLPKDIVFVDTPFNILSLNLYAHKNAQTIASIAAIDGFSYHGFRTKYTEQGYEFLNMPTSISAIQLFLKGQSSHLISYRSPFEYHIQDKKIELKDEVSILPLLDVPTFYGISAQSPHLEKLKTILEEYASMHQLSLFGQAN